MKKELGITVLLVVLCIIVTAINPRFLGASNLTNMARLIGMYGIFSIGVGLVIITSGIDLSIGSVFALQGVILAIMLRGWNWPWPLAVLATVLGVMLLGAMHGWFIAKIRMQPFIVTLCGLLFYRGLARFIANDETKGFGSTVGVAFETRKSFFDQQSLGIFQTHFLQPRGEPRIRRSLQGQIKGCHNTARAHQHCAFSHMVQLTHVAWPLMLTQGFERLGRERHHTTAITLAMLSQKMLGQRTNVFAPVTQWRQVNFDSIQAEQQVLTKLPLSHFLC